MSDFKILRNKIRLIHTILCRKSLLTSQDHCVLPSRQRSTAAETSPSYLATGGEESSATTLYTAEQHITWTPPKKAQWP